MYYTAAKYYKMELMYHRVTPNYNDHRLRWGFDLFLGLVYGESYFYQFASATNMTNLIVVTVGTRALTRSGRTGNTAKSFSRA